MSFWLVRSLIVIGGILLPYVTAPAFFAPSSLGAALFPSALNAICWGSILLATLSYRRPNSAIFPIVIGFAWPTLFYLTLDSKSSPFTIIFLPFWNLALVFIGWLVGRRVDREDSLD